MFGSRISSGATEKVIWVVETLRKNSRVVPQYGRSSQKSVDRYERKTKTQLLAWKTKTSRSKNWKLLEICPKFAFKSSQHVCTWNSLVDLRQHSVLWITSLALILMIANAVGFSMATKSMIL